MALEIWILLGLAGGAIVVGTVIRLRRRRSAASPAPESASKIYPLW